MSIKYSIFLIYKIYNQNYCYITLAQQKGVIKSEILKYPLLQPKSKSTGEYTRCLGVIATCLIKNKKRAILCSRSPQCSIWKLMRNSDVTGSTKTPYRTCWYHASVCRQCQITICVWYLSYRVPFHFRVVTHLKFRVQTLFHFQK